MEAWADMRGHLPARENTGGPAVDGHLISTVHRPRNIVLDYCQTLA